jgi:ribosomal protein S18 acetylase RimI-like enzyme
MTERTSIEVRRAEPADAADIARMLDAFSREYDDFTPGPQALAERLHELLEAGEVTVLLGGPGPDGLAVLRFRPNLYTKALNSYLEELYVAPEKRGQGIGRALMETAIDVSRRQGADDMHLGTSEDDVAARALYESLGFINREGGPDGPIQYFYEREL